MSQTLYRKYRPKNFDEIIAQTHIVRTLVNAIKNNRVGQAYLFTGPRGTGKTSLARIFAKAVNCENSKNAISCEKCPACRAINDARSLDLIEIDAASNTGVDNIRELRETVALPPTLLKYKIYIIDEVHMLSTGAFNALLKTLEEPPLHVIFILATTEIHKVPETILSRCQRFDFTRLPVQNIIEKLSHIAKDEKVKIEKEALEMIAIASEGGMRDAESLLGQIISLEDKNITAQEVKDILGTTDRNSAYEFCELLIEKKSASAIAKINSFLEEGYDLAVFGKTFVNYLRQLMLLKISEDLKNSFSFELTGERLEKMIAQAKKVELHEIIIFINLFLDAQNKIGSSILPQLPLEIAVIKATRKFPTERIRNEELSIKPTKNTGEADAADHSTNSVRPKLTSSERNSDSKENISNTSSEAAQKNNNPVPSIEISTVRQNWSKLLIDIRPFNHSLSALLSNCRPMRTNGANLTLATPYEFYKERLGNEKNKLTIEEILGKILGCNVKISIEIDKSLTPKNEASSPAAEPMGSQNSLLDSALEIMGGKVVSE